MGDFEDMITFYDEQKYTLLAAKVGNLVKGNGRPYQILFLQNIKDMSHYIFINLHNGHRISRESLEHRLSANINRGLYLAESRWMQAEHMITITILVQMIQMQMIYLKL